VKVKETILRRPFSGSEGQKSVSGEHFAKKMGYQETYKYPNCKKEIPKGKGKRGKKEGGGSGSQ